MTPPRTRAAWKYAPSLPITTTHFSGRETSLQRDPAREPPKKKQKKKHQKVTFAGQAIVDIIVDGSEDKPFSIYTDVLSAYSNESKDKFEKLDGEWKPLKISNVNYEDFDTFIKWAYDIYGGGSPYDSVEVDGIEEMDQDLDDDGETDTEDDGSEKGSETERENMNNRDEAGTDTHRRAANDAIQELAVKQESNTTLAWIRNPLDGASSEASSSSRVFTTPSVSQDPKGASCATGTSKSTGLNRRGRMFLRLVDLYILGIRYEAFAFMRAIMLTLQRLVYRRGTVPCPIVVKHALNHLTVEAPLCRFLTLCYTCFRTLPKTRIATLPGDFVTEVLDVVFGGLIPILEENSCDFHEHENEDDIEKCQKQRPHDPDVPGNIEKYNRFRQL